MDYPADKLHRLAARRRRHRPEVQLAARSRKPIAAQARRDRAAAALRRSRRQLPDARAQRARQGRQPQQRARPFDGRADRRLRCRPRAGARLPRRRRSAISTRTRSSSWSRRRTSSSIPIRSSATCSTFEHDAVRERDVLRHHPARPRQVERLLLLRLGRRAAPRGARRRPSGFSGVSITEDCETALELHSRGWNSVYVDKPLIAGLQPATFASFIGQRTPLGAGHDADPALPLSAASSAASRSRSGSATCRARCSGCSRSRA